MVAIIVGLIVFNVINIPLYLSLFRKVFTEKEEFKEAILFYLKPDLFSLFKGKLLEDLRAELKLGLFFSICILILTGEILLMQKVLTFLNT